MADETRIKSKKQDIDTEKVLDFFEHRGEGYNPEHPLTSILYQDQDPELAVRRDCTEKNRIMPLLGAGFFFHSVLDIGCGIGRWADTLADHCDHYVGIDFSSKLIEIARDRHPNPKMTFHVLAAQDISGALQPDAKGFDLAVISGVLIYMNDRQVESCLGSLALLMAKNSVVYIREPFGVGGRLTLDGTWSAELRSTYRAIYRTSDELSAIINQTIGQSNFTKARFSPLYDEEDLNNRAETRQFYTILKNGG